MTARPEPTQETPCPKCGAPCKTTVAMRGGDHGWSTSDLERTQYRYAAPPQPLAAVAPAMAEVSAAMGYLSELLVGLLDEGEWLEAEARIDVVRRSLAAPAVVVSAEPVARGNAVTVPADKLARLQRKAARYDWLRHGDNDEKALKFYPCPSVIAAGKPTMFLLRNDALDAAIDAALASTRPSKGAA